MNTQAEAIPQKVTVNEIILFTTKFLNEHSINYRDIPDHFKRKIMSSKYNLELVYWLNALVETYNEAQEA